MKIILLALRSLIRFRLYSAINIMGLALSLACVIIISRYVYSELTTDHFASNHERLFLSVRHWNNNEKVPTLLTTQNIMMRKDYKNPLDIPEIEKHTSFVSLKDVTIEVENKGFSAHVLATDSVFLQILDFPVLKGDQTKLLKDPKGAVLSESFAKKLFQNQDPIGKIINYNGQLLTIQGITGNVETKSSLSFDLLISRALQWRWPPVNYYSIALAVPHTDIDVINKKLKSTYDQQNARSFLFQLFPLDKLYMETYIQKGEKTFLQGNASSVHILSVTALLLLLVGVFNFVHLNSVVILKRRKEFSMKKVFGARPAQLFIQLYIENLFLTAFALFLAWVIIEMTYDIQVHILEIKSIVQKHYNIWISILLLLLLPAITALHTFVRFSRKPVISSLQNIDRSKDKPEIKTIFLTLQYGITLSLIVCSLFFIKQLNYMLATDPGYRTKDIIKVWFQRPTSSMSYTADEIKHQEEVNKYILETLQSSPIFETFCFGISPYEFPLNPLHKKAVRIPGGEWEEVIHITISPDFLTLYNIPVFGKGLPIAQNEVLLNETAKRLFSQNEKLPELLESDWNAKGTYLLVKGFTNDFQTVHLAQHNKPIILSIHNESMLSHNKLMAAISPGYRQEAILFLEKLHNEIGQGDFEYTFVSDEIEELYNKDKQVAIIYSVFALIAILISSLGLFGLSLFDVQQRYREIAIRKVNGATTSIIMQILLRKYYKLLAIAFIVAAPVTWLTIHKYLESFVHKADISWWLFAIALLLTGAISLLTLIWQIRKAARTNPAEVIKSE